jgi:hypothetical protein
MLPNANHASLYPGIGFAGIGLGDHERRELSWVEYHYHAASMWWGFLIKKRKFSKTGMPATRR